VLTGDTGVRGGVPAEAAALDVAVLARTGQRHHRLAHLRLAPLLVCRRG
jgi:hypothetical protein